MAAGYKETRNLASRDAAYIAGLIDGEGTVTLSRKHAGENRQLVVSISSTERQILEFVLSRTGAGKITAKRTAKPNHAKSFTFAITNRQALTLLSQTVEFLQSYKRKRAELILRDYLRLTPRNGKYSEQQRQERTEFEQAILSLRH